MNELLAIILTVGLVIFAVRYIYLCHLDEKHDNKNR